MIRFRQQTGLSQSPWMVTIATLLLLVVLVSAMSHSPVAVCCLTLIAVFLFALVQLPPSETADKPEHVRGFDDGSPWLLRRPPPSLA